MHRLLLLIGLSLLVLCAPHDAPAQITFERAYGGQFYDAGSEVLQLAGQGFLIIGTTRSISNDTTDAWLIRTDAHGDTLWTHTYGGDDFDSGVSMVRATDGGYILAVASKSIRPDDYQIYLVKIDEQGEAQWTRSHGGPEYEYVHSIAATRDGGYIVFSYTMSYGAGSRDFYLMKVNQSGDSLWAHTYGGADFDLGSSVQQTADGGYILCGSTNSFQDPDGDVYLVRTDASGDTLWTRSYGEAGYDHGYHVLVTKDGGFLVAGLTESLGEAFNNGLLIKTDAHGVVQWTAVYGGELRNYFDHAIQLASGDIVAVGSGHKSVDGDYDALIVRFDSDGNEVWTRYFGGDAYDRFNCLAETSDGGFVCVGNSESFGVEVDDQLYLVKTDGNGMITGLDQEALRPASCLLHQNYPNPFNPETTINYALPRSMPVSLIITDALGREVARLAEMAYMQAGTHSVLFNAEGIPSGVYLYRLETENAVLVRKMVVMK